LGTITAFYRNKFIIITRDWAGFADRMLDIIAQMKGVAHGFIAIKHVGGFFEINYPPRDTGEVKQRFALSVVLFYLFIRKHLALARIKLNDFILVY
jgi:hypothetical protein